MIRSTFSVVLAAASCSSPQQSPRRDKPREIVEFNGAMLFLGPMPALVIGATQRQTTSAWRDIRRIGQVAGRQVGRRANSAGFVYNLPEGGRKSNKRHGGYHRYRDRIRLL